jgi:hypothetical protein
MIEQVSTIVNSVIYFVYFPMIHIEYFYFDSFLYFHAGNPVNDQQWDDQPITTVEILEP